MAVAETEHVGRAATLLHVSQSPLSRQIRQLEEATGLDLFTRERQRLRLTDAGRWLLPRAREVLRHLDSLEREIAQQAAGEAGPLRIGFVKTAMWTSVLPRALRRFRARRADVAIELRKARPGLQLAALRRGELDVAFVHEADEELTSRLLRREALCLALPSDHRLASRKRIAPRDLDGLDWIALELRRSRSRDRLLAACAKRGFVPNIRFTTADQETMLGLVAAGMGAALVPESASAAGVVVRALPWLELSRSLHVVTREESPLVKELLACLDKTAQV